MAYKQFQIDEIGLVTVYKRRGTKRIKLSVDHDGNIKLSMPTWLPYKTGLSYADSKRDWLAEQLKHRSPITLRHGQSIGSKYRLTFELYEGVGVRSRILASNDIRVQYPTDFEPNDPAVQAVAEKACVRALRTDAETLLPVRLRQLAERYDLRYRSFSVRQLKGRWGSCDQAGHITINLFVMQLPTPLLEYVLLHELAHTEYLDHSSNFWAVLMRLDPLAKEHRKQLRSYRPVVGGVPTGDNLEPVAY